MDSCPYDLYRVLQFALAVAGLTFSLTSVSLYTLLVIIYAVVIVYEIILIVCLLTNRVTLSGRTQSIFDLVLGVIVLVYIIYVLTACPHKDIWMVLAIVCGFVLPALLFISAYTRF